jgi:hypothetical protein
MKPFDEQQRPARKALQDECGLSGHNMRFTHLGPLGDPWFSCTLCHLSKVELTEKPAVEQ